MATTCWFFNTDESEEEGKNAHEQMITRSCMAAWGGCRGKGAKNTLLQPNGGDIVFLYRAGHGMVASGMTTQEEPVESNTIFNQQGEFHRRLLCLKGLTPEKVLTARELFRRTGYRVPARNILCKIGSSRACKFLCRYFDMHGDTKLTNLTPMQARILEFLAGQQGWVTRQNMAVVTRDIAGFSKALGAPTNPPLVEDSLESLGLVERHDSAEPFKYRITSAGRKVLAEHSATQLPGTKSALVHVEDHDLSDDQIDDALRTSRLLIGVVPTSSPKALARQRRGQARLRELTIKNYGGRCAVCDITEHRLLIASHIVGWAEDVQCQGDLQNVICLCRIHDVLFEAGYWSLGPKLNVIKKTKIKSALVRQLLDSMSAFRVPDAFSPARRFVKRHSKKNGLTA